jgi:hypothetical protein
VVAIVLIAGGAAGTAVAGTAVGWGVMMIVVAGTGALVDVHPAIKTSASITTAAIAAMTGLMP